MEYAVQSFDFEKQLNILNWKLWFSKSIICILRICLEIALNFRFDG